jgi:tetratricopeptide (TPR) repeat protein
MDPITIAARRFAIEFDTFWRPPPGHGLKGPPVLRLVADRTDRKEMIKALRMMEWQPESRRPFVIVESAFASEAAFALATATTLEQDYATLRKGLADDGLTIPALVPAEHPVTMSRLAAQLDLAARGVSQVLEGLLLVLVPASIDGGAPYARFVEHLASMSNGSTLRVCVLDHPSLRNKLPGQASFAIDHDALFAFLKELKTNRSKGPASAAPQLSPPQKAALEKELKRRVPSQPTGDELRTLLIDAGKAMSDGQFKTAVRKFRAARMLCHLSGLTQEEAATSIALGSAALAAQDKRAAIAAYRAAKQIALAGELPILAAQAELGIAGAHWSTRDYRDARASYSEVMRLAASIPALRLEAMRMEAECFVLEEHPSKAIETYGQVLDSAERLEPRLRRTTSFVHAGKSLTMLLLSLGQAGPSREVEARVARLNADRTTPGSQEAAP